MMDAICEITRQEFDRGDRLVIQAALRAEAHQKGRQRGLNGPLRIHFLCQNAAIFGHLVEGHQMYDECDNAGVVFALNGSAPSDPVLYE
jgi:hypothetical protein